MLHRLQLVIKNISILSFNLRPTSTRPSSGSQDHQHHRIRCTRHVLVTSAYRPEADEQLLLLRRTRMRVLLALRARIECDCSCSVLARERSQLSGGLNRIAGPRGLRPNVSIQCLSRPIRPINQTLFHSNNAHRLCFEVADFWALRTVTHLPQLPCRLQYAMRIRSTQCAAKPTGSSQQLQYAYAIRIRNAQPAPWYLSTHTQYAYAIHNAHPTPQPADSL